MTVYPIDRSDTLLKAIQIAQQLGDGTPMVANPLSSLVSTANSNIATATTGIDGFTTDPTLTPEQIDDLNSISAQLGTLSGQVASLNGHANTLVFGDSSGSLISGGITSNAGQFIAANNLNDTYNALTNPAEATCDLLNDFLGTLLGPGASLLQAAINAVQDVLGLIAQGVQAVLGAVATILGALASAGAALVNLIASELATYASWLAKQIDFGLGSFFSGLFSDPCINIITTAVGTAALIDILND